ncbi:hypothetical protein FQN55_002652 [Onygenales sp. PD_40]|nr:hypothetical protein FQN55_002652 [Onygenales sp. PD_40]KAK2780050.1 hypothetical protein FQN52_002275 [Onygenales sp. PD_12]
MDSSRPKASDELVHVVWASHILSYMNPYTIIASDRPSNLQSKQEVNDDDGSDFDDGPNHDFSSIDNEPLTDNSEVLRQKFLDCICELLAHTKGGKTVTATALREKEDEVEVDIARNNGFNAKDEAYLGSLKRFLAMQDDNVSRQALAEYSHKFLRDTIAYTSERVDSQAEAVAKLLKRSPYRPSRHSGSGGYTQDACLLGCCSAAQEPAFTKTQNLLEEFLNFDFYRSMFSTARDRDETRCKIVELAAGIAHSQQAIQATQGALDSMIPSVDPHKAIQKWRILARPVTCLRILSQIARLLPNFQVVTFISMSPPAPLKLQTSQIPTIQEAWKRLGLPSGPNGDIPPNLARKDGRFRRECGYSLFTHCEIQLLTRHEAEPSLAPTLAYFGCSKKACFLCESFLALSPLKVRTRGRHGECHPQWAVQPCNSESAKRRLKSLCKTIKQKIRARLEPRHNPPPVAIHQSSAVSELKSSDMRELTRQSRNRELANREGQGLRERRQILSVGPPEIWYRDLRTLCVMCQTPCARRCTRCLATWYCSQRCQSLDWPAHKLLCSRYRKFLDTCPSKDYGLGIWFQRDTCRPKLIWAPILCLSQGFHHADFDHFLGHNNGVRFTIPFAENKRRGLELDHYLTIWYCDRDEIPNKSILAAVEACHGMTVPYNFRGHYVVMRGQHGSCTGTADHEFPDITLADFRHTLDWFSTGSVFAVKISCPLEQSIYGRELFTAVDVDPDFPSTSEVSPLSVALGLPIMVCQLEQDDLDQTGKTPQEASVEEQTRMNPYARVLMTDIDMESENWGKAPQFWDIDGTILLQREDREDLDLACARHLCRYCLDVLKPLFERAVSGEISRQNVLEQITPKKAIAWKPVDSSTGVVDIDKPRPRRGFVARMGSARWEYLKQGSRVLEVTDKIFREMGWLDC